jgi:transposase
MNFLSKKEIRELKTDHRAERDSRYADRIKSILMLNEGVPVAKIAHYLLLDEKSIRNYRDRYSDGGLEALCNDSYYGRKGILNKSELAMLENELRSKIYPTTTSIIAYVKRKFGVQYSISGITKLLERIGFSYKKPQAVPGKANGEAQEHFLWELDQLKQQKSPENPILYVDSTHPQHNSHPDYGWLPKGEKVQLKTNTGRQRVTLNGALDADTHEIIVREDKVLNAQHTIKFFQKIEASYPDASTIYLILDNAGYYKGKKIREFLENSKIELRYLPPYSPNLNLIERVWKYFKKKVLANIYYKSFKDFRKACLAFFHRRRWRACRGDLSTLLTDNFQILNA